MALTEKKKMITDYYYGNETEQFKFFVLPKALFFDEKFKDMSIDSKVLYSMMLDRMHLSAKNKWFSLDGRIYIYFKVTEIVNRMNIGTNKAMKILKELKEMNLIEKEKQGLGRPDIIYVKKFTDGTLDGLTVEDDYEEEKIQPYSSEMYEDEYDGYKNAKERRNVKKQERKNVESESNTDIVMEENVNEEIKNETDNCESVRKELTVKNDKNVDFKNESSIVLKAKNKTFENENTGSIKNENSAFSKRESNNTNYNNTKLNNTNLINLINDQDICENQKQIDEMDMIDKINNQSSVNLLNNDTTSLLNDKDDVRKEIQEYREIIEENISYDVLCQTYSKEDVDEIVENMLEIMCMKQKYVTVAKTQMYTEVFKSRIMKMDMFTVQYILDSLENTYSKIGNIKSYVRTAIYNAYTTINSYYKTKVNYDTCTQAIC